MRSLSSHPRAYDQIPSHLGAQGLFWLVICAEQLIASLTPLRQGTMIRISLSVPKVVLRGSSRRIHAPCNNGRVLVVRKSLST